MRTEDSHPSKLPALQDAPTPVNMGQFVPPQSWFDPNEEKQGFELSDYLHSLRRRWLPGLGLGSLVASVIAASLWLFIPINYEAFMSFEVAEGGDSVLIGRGRPYQHKEHEVFKATQIARLRSTPVIETALRKPGIMQLPMVKQEERPEAWLPRELDASYMGKDSDILRVSLRGEDYEDTIKLLDAVKEAYMDKVVFEDRNVKAKQLESLKRRKRENTVEMEKTHGEIIRLADETGSNESEQVEQRQRLEMTKLQSLMGQMNLLSREAKQATMDYQLLRSSIENRATRVKDWEIRDVLRQFDRDYAMKDSMITQLESMKAEGRTASYQAIDAQIEELKHEQRRLERKLRPEAEERVLALKGIDDEGDRALLRTLGEKAIAFQRDFQGLTKEIEDQEAIVRDFGGYSSRLDRLKAEVEGIQELTKEISNKIVEIELQLEQPSRVTPLHSATIPDNNSFWMKVFQVGGAWSLSLMATLLGVAFWDCQQKRVNTSKDISKGHSELRVIGSLPQLGARFGVNKKVLEIGLNRSIDGIRATLLYAKAQDAAQAVMVTSALAQEGKSTVASQLAVSLARSGRRTLLIDGDLRNPQQHLVLGMPFDHGLCELLRNQMQLDDVIRPTAAEGLWALLAGYRDATTDQALSSKQFADTLEQLRSRFDFIIIDAGPVMTSADPLLIGQHVDLAVMSVRRDISRSEKVQDAHQRLRAVGVKVFGAVLNGGTADVRRSELTNVSDQASSRPQLEEVAS